MKSQTTHTAYLASIVIGLVLISGYIFLPFITVLALAAILAISLDPLYKYILGKVKGRKNLASGLTISMFLLAVIVPLIFITQNIFTETEGFYQALNTGQAVSLDKIENWVQSNVQSIFPKFTFDIREKLGETALFVLNHLSTIFAGTLSFILKLILAMLALFYFLRDGDKFKKHIIDISPLNTDDDEKVITSMKGSINSIVMGSVLVALLQALIAGVGFTIFGVPNPALCAIIVGITALVPGVGPSLVWVPATIYLFFFGGNFSYAWIGLLIYSPLLMFYVDTVIGPGIIQKGVNIHPLLVLFSILGGVTAFGPEGLILGPVILAFLFTFIRFYQEHAKNKAE